MNTWELPASITALALAIGAQIEDLEELGLLATAFTQLGDTLATMAAQRALWEKKQAQAKGKTAEEESVAST